MKIKFTVLNLFLILGTTTLSFSQWSDFSTINTSVCNATGKQVDPRIASDDKGGAVIVWEDYRTPIADIYVQRIDKNGFVKWATNGLGACTNAVDQISPSITEDGKSGAIVAWSDFRSGTSLDIYAQKIDSNGTAQWTTNGIIVTSKSIKEQGAKITSDGNGGVFVVWEQMDAMGVWDIWAQHINASGVVTWATGGIPVCGTVANRINPRVQEDGKGGIFVVWQDYRSGANYDIYAQRINVSGTLLWGSAGIAVCTATNTQSEPKIDPKENTGGVYVCWVDKRNGVDYDLYAQLIDSSGNAKWATNGVVVTAATNNQSAPDIVSSRTINGVIVTWKDIRSGTNYDIYAQRIDSTGAAQWTTDGIVISNLANDQLNPNIDEDMLGGAIIAWQDSLTGEWDVKSQRVDAAGNIQWTANGVNVGNAPNNQVSVKNISDGNYGSIYVFQDKRMGVFDIYAHHLYANGTPIGFEEYSIVEELLTFPNPFSSSITLSFKLKSVEDVRIEGNDILGKNVPAFSTGILTNTGLNYQYTINGLESLNNGVYFITLRFNQSTTTVRMIKNDK